MIDTVWPSSRRLAISPPQERATSSGWGATKTWVMAGRVYRSNLAPRRSPRPASLADERHERDRAVVPLGPLVAVPDDHEQVLAVARADRQHESSTGWIQLLTQRLGHGGSRRRDQNPAPRRSLRRTDASIAHAHLDEVRVAQDGEAIPGHRRELRDPLDRHDPAADGGEDGRLVAGAGPD